MLILGSNGGDYWVSAAVLDQLVKQWIDYFSNPFWDRFFSLLTHMGSSVVLIIGAIILTVILVLRRRGLDALFMDLSLIISWWLMILLKTAFARPRPLGEHLTPATGFSFPSGHAMLSTVFYGFLAYLMLSLFPGRTGKTIAIGLVVLILLIGISRVYLNVHYFSDVLAGFLLGGIITWLIIKLRQKADGKSRI